MPELPVFAREKQGCHCMRPYPWSSPGKLFVPAARHGNVTFAAGGSYKVRAQCDCHTPRGPNTMWRGKTAHPKNHQDLIVWPFPFRIDLFPCIRSKITFSFVLLCESIACCRCPGKVSPRKRLCCMYESTFDCIILFQWLHVLPQKIKCDLWKTAQRGHTDHSQYITVQWIYRENIDSSDLRLERWPTAERSHWCIHKNTITGCLLNTDCYQNSFLVYLLLFSVL